MPAGVAVDPERIDDRLDHPRIQGNAIAARLNATKTDSQMISRRRSRGVRGGSLSFTLKDHLIPTGFASH